MKLYTASSWRCERYPAIVDALRDLGHEVYDFRTAEGASFKWQDLDPGWDQEEVPVNRFRAMVDHSIAAEAHRIDMEGLDGCDAVVLILPCGTSAHWEAGYAVGTGKPVLILADGDLRPELTYRSMTLCADFGVLASELDLIARKLAERPAGDVEESRVASTDDDGWPREVRLCYLTDLRHVIPDEVDENRIQQSRTYVLKSAGDAEGLREEIEKLPTFDPHWRDEEMEKQPDYDGVPPGLIGDWLRRSDVLAALADSTEGGDRG